MHRNGYCCSSVQNVLFSLFSFSPFLNTSRHKNLRECELYSYGGVVLLVRETRVQSGARSICFRKANTVGTRSELAEMLR